MFKGMGGKIIEGAIEKVGQSGRKTGEAALSFWKGFKSVPGINIPVWALQLFADVPKRYNAMPEEKKQALFEAAVAAGTKAMMAYAGGKAGF